MPHGIDMVGIRRASLVPLMPRLATAGTAAWRARGAGWGGGWIARWRFRGVLGLLAYARLEIGHARVELGELLLLLAEYREQCADEVPNGDGGQAPFLNGNPRWWCLVIHADSMRGMSAVVKLVRLPGSRSGPVNDYDKTTRFLFGAALSRRSNR